MNEDSIYSNHVLTLFWHTLVLESVNKIVSYVYTEIFGIKIHFTLLWL